MTSEEKTTSKLDYTLVLILLFLFFASCTAIYSAQTTGQYKENFLIKQILWYMVSAGMCAGVVKLDSDQLKKLSWYSYGLGLCLLMMLMIAPAAVAPTINGAKSWFRFPAFGSIQPSEFVKIFVILVLARIIYDHHEKNPEKNFHTDLCLLIKLGIAVFFPFAMIIMQPDLGTGLVFIAILLGMVLVSGITWKLLVPIFSGGSLAAGSIIYLVLAKPNLVEKYLGVKPYQFGRIYSWLDPYNYQSSEGYQLTSSLLAIGSGMTGGKGFLHREIYMPESQTDFIFSVVGEEFGFIGSCLLIILFFILVSHIAKVGMETKNAFYTYICAGVVSMITFHVFQNIGMTIGFVPITGIPLPFISYGGSSLMGNMLALGLIFSVRYHYKKYIFSASA